MSKIFNINLKESVREINWCQTKLIVLEIQIWNRKFDKESKAAENRRN